MNKLSLLLLALTVTACSDQNDNYQSPSTDKGQVSQQQDNQVTPLQYPQTKQGDVKDLYFDESVADPYRWLEDDRSLETAEWVKAQNAVTFDYLAKIPYREQIKKTLTDKWNYEKINAPFKEGEYFYFYKNDGLQNQYVVYRYKAGEKDKAEVFLDPNTFSEDGTTSLASLR